MTMRYISEVVQHERYAGEVTDAHGNVKPAWDPSVDLGIYAFNPGTSGEPAVQGHERVVTEPTLYVPTGAVIGHQDRVTVRGKLFEVDGDLRDFRNPYGSVMDGCAVGLKAVTG